MGAQGSAGAAGNMVGGHNILGATQKGLDGLETGLYYPPGSTLGHETGSERGSTVYNIIPERGPSVSIIKQWELEEARKDERAQAAIAKSQWLIENRSWCFFDLETTNLKANFGEILVGCIKPRGKKAEVYTADEHFGDTLLVEDLAERLLDFDYVVTWYGTGFDMPYLATRLQIAKAPNLGPVRHVDLYYTARKNLALSSNRLQMVAESLLGKSGKTRIIPTIWTAAMKGDEKALKYIADHCVADVKETEKIFDLLAPYRNLGATPVRIY